MATRADFYIMRPDKTLEFIGSTSNSYYGDFEKATNSNDYLKSVTELLRDNKSIEGKWYWPWAHSKITDEVFIFKHTPKWFNKSKGVLMTKTYTSDPVSSDYENAKLPIVPYKERYNRKYYSEDGEYDSAKVEWIELPIMKIK